MHGIRNICESVFLSVSLPINRLLAAKFLGVKGSKVGFFYFMGGGSAPLIPMVFKGQL